MRERVSRALAVGWVLVGVIRRSQLSLLAAAIAYYAFASLFPLLLLSLAAVSTVGGDALASAVVSQLSDVLSPSGETLVRETLTNARGRGGATLAGLALLIWGGLKLFRGLDVAFSTIYGTEQAVTFVSQVRNAVTALFAVGFAVGTTVLISVFARGIGIQLGPLLGVLALPAVLTVAFLPLYLIFPDVPLGLRGALPGAVFAAVGWTALSAGFQLYAARAGGVALYGVVGAVLLLVTWFYVGGLVLLLGAVLNGVLAGDVDTDVNDDRHTDAIRDRQLQQGPLRDSEQRSMSGEDSVDAGSTRSRPESDDVDESDEDIDVGESDEDIDVGELRAEIDELEARIEEKTLHRDEIERDLKRYVRRRVRRGHATGWGPYLVLLYGTVMTVAAFYFLGSVIAFLSMIVIWLSTLGLYVLMMMVGLTKNAVGTPGKLLDKVRDFRR